MRMGLGKEKTVSELGLGHDARRIANRMVRAVNKLDVLGLPPQFLSRLCSG